MARARVKRWYLRQQIEKIIHEAADAEEVIECVDLEFGQQGLDYLEDSLGYDAELISEVVECWRGE